MASSTSRAPSQRWPAWEEVTGKPREFPATPHRHEIRDIRDLERRLEAIQKGVGSGLSVRTGLKAADPVFVDASSSAVVTEELPDPANFDLAIAVRTDTTTNTGKIADPNGNTIYWDGRAVASAFELAPLRPLLFGSDRSNWYVENPPLYQIEQFNPGGQLPETIVWRHKARHRLKTIEVLIDAESAPTAQHDFIVERLHDDTPNRTTTPEATLSVASGVEAVTKPLEVTVPKNHVLRLKTGPSGQNFSGEMKGVSINVAAYPV